MHAAKMLSVPPDALVKALCFRKISVGGESLEKHESKATAGSAADALSKAMYTKLFNWVVRLVNKALKSKEMSTAQLQVSVLDIFGFEIFPKNCFEQFCINLANEKLQLHFNQFNFMQVHLDIHFVPCPAIQLHSLATAHHSASFLVHLSQRRIFAARAGPSVPPV